MWDINILKINRILWAFPETIRFWVAFVIQYIQRSPLILFIISVFVLGLLVRILLRIKSSLFEPYVLLELTPPASTEKTAYTTQQLFSVIHNLGKQRTFSNKLINNKIVFSCEIVSTHEKGIRYIIRAPAGQAHNLKRSLLSYLPQIQVTEVQEYLPKNTKCLKLHHYKVSEFNQIIHFAHSLKKQNVLEEHDPVAYITGMMTKLAPTELITFQIVLSPTVKKDAATIKSRIINNEDILGYLQKKVVPDYLNIFQVFFSIIGWVATTIANDMNSTQKAYTSFHSSGIKEKSANPFEQQAIKLIEEKIDQSLFEARLRLLVVVKNKHEVRERVKGFISSLGVFSVPSYQSLKEKYHFPLFNRYFFFTFRKRLLSLVFNTSPTLLSVSEVSDLYHFPFARVTQTENIVKVHSKELPAPISLKKTVDFDIVFAKNMYGGVPTTIGLTKDERARHMYIIGATGSGKTTMLTSMIDQDIQNNKGICVIDPHGDLSESLLDSIPDSRINDLIYFNPYDIKYPIGINLLELTPGLEEDESLIEKEFIAESIISLFRKMFSDGSSGHPHRIEYILRNTIHTAFTLENPTLFTLFDLLNNPSFQKKAIQGLQDENLKNFWKYEFSKAGDFQQVKMTAPITSRIGRFLFSPSAKRILEQEKSTINFDEILDTQKLLICNLSKGNIGEDTSEVMGIMILNKLQLAALKRARRERKERNDFYLYVDEFQNFATPSFVQMLSEARKYGLNLTIAEQSTSQQSDKNLTHVILANVGTVVSFRSANPIDEELFIRQFTPYVGRGEIANLPAYHFYMKTSAMKPEEPFSGETIPLQLTVDKDKRIKFIDASREHFAITYRSKQTLNDKTKQQSMRKGNNQKLKKEGQQTSRKQGIFPED